jgi:hypothetical protein
LLGTRRNFNGYCGSVAIDFTRIVPPSAPNQWWRTPRPRSPPSELPWSSARPLLSRRRPSARALLGRKLCCTEFSSPAHQLQPDIRIWIGSPVVPVAPDRLAVGRLAGPEWSSAGAALSRWPVLIAGASTPGGDIRGLSGRPRRRCNSECCNCQRDHDSHRRLPNAGPHAQGPAVCNLSIQFAAPHV